MRFRCCSRSTGSMAVSTSWLNMHQSCWIHDRGHHEHEIALPYNSPSCRMPCLVAGEIAPSTVFDISGAVPLQRVMALFEICRKVRNSISH